jgi:hypothetical protein
MYAIVKLATRVNKDMYLKLPPAAAHVLLAMMM